MTFGMRRRQNRHLVFLFSLVDYHPPAHTLPPLFFGMASDLKDTLQLPKTDFAMRANLVQREPARLAHWEKFAAGLFAAIQKKRA